MRVVTKREGEARLLMATIKIIILITVFFRLNENEKKKRTCVSRI